jgi:hypothetical protein
MNSKDFRNIREAKKLLKEAEIKKGLMTMGPMDFITATLFHEYDITQDVIEMAVEKIQAFNASEEQLQSAMELAGKKRIGPLYALRLIMSEAEPV